MDGVKYHTPAALTGSKVARCVVIDAALLPHVSEAIAQLTIDGNWYSAGVDVETVTDEFMSALDYWYTSAWVGMIAAFAGPPPPGWLLCDGATFSPGDYPELAAACPGLQLGRAWRVPFMVDKFALGGVPSQISQFGGAEEVTLTENNMPPHSHTVTGAALGWPDGPDVDPVGTAAITNPTTTSSSGGGVPFSIMPPYQRVVYAIWTGRIID